MISDHPHPAVTYTAFRIVLVGEAIVFLLAALLHSGAFGVPPLLAAMIVEGLCGIACLISAYAIWTGQRWALTAAVIVQVFILASVLLGISIVLRNGDIRTSLNVGLHVVMLALIVAGLSLLAIPATRQAFSGKRTQ